MIIKYYKSNYGPVVLAGLMDAAFIIILFVFTYSLISFPFIIQANPNISIFAGFIIYRFITIGLFDATIGMKTFNLVFLNGEEKNLSLPEKLLASVFVLFEGVDYYRQIRTYV